MSLAHGLLALQLATISPAAEESFAHGQARFALELYRRLDDTPGNLAFSPLSIARTLALLHEAAAGATELELERVVHLPHTGAAKQFEALLSALTRPLDVKGARQELELASALFPRSGLVLQPSFIERARLAFGSQIWPLDFTDSIGAVRAINGWVEERTHGKICDIVSPEIVDAGTALVIADALYFNADWAEPFKERATQRLPFHAANGTDVSALFLGSFRDVIYGESEHSQFVELPFAGNRVAFVAVLPKPGWKLADVVAREDFERWTTDRAMRYVALQMPKLDFEASFDLEDPLRALGLQLAFDSSRADFSRACEHGLFLDRILHRARIELDERGATAAAATIAKVAPTSNFCDLPPAPIPFIADHPYLFFLRHVSTGQVLFVGRVDQPAE